MWIWRKLLTLQLEVKCGIPLQDLVFQYLSSTSDAFACQIVCEGKPSALLPVISGVRQGFFLSPRIFLMIMGSNEEMWRHAQEKPEEVQITLQKDSSVRELVTPPRTHCKNTEKELTENNREGS